MGDEANKGQDKGSTENLSQPSALEKLTSGIEEGKQYTGAETLKLVNDALSADGREQKDRAEKAEAEVTRVTEMANGLTTQVNTISGQLSTIQKTQEDAEAEAIKEDPVALASLRVRQANTREATRLQGVGAEYEAKNTKLTTRETEVNQRLVSVNIKLAAIAGGVDEKALADLVPDGDPGRLAKMAGILKQSSIDQPLEIDPVTGKPKPAALTQPPASVKSAGTETKSTAEKMLEKAKAK